MLVALSSSPFYSSEAFVVPTSRATNRLSSPPSSSSLSCPKHVPTFVSRNNGSFQSTALKASDSTMSEAAYTDAAWSAISALPRVADFYSVQTIEPPLLLDVFLNPAKHGAGENAVAAQKTVEKILTAAGVDVSKLRRELEIFLSNQMTVVGSNANKNMSRALSDVLETAREMKTTLGDSFISTEGLLLALAQHDNKFFSDQLGEQGVEYETVFEEVKKSREKSGPANSRSAESMYEALSKYGKDFTQLAAEGKLDPVIGRDDEIRRAIQILSRRTKNNPILLGDPGKFRITGNVFSTHE